MEKMQCVEKSWHGRGKRVWMIGNAARQVKATLLSNRLKVNLRLVGEIGRGNEQIWFHDNFLRGVPESMDCLVRTKIKGNTVDSNDDRRILNFDDLPPLPIPDKQPSAVLNEMENAILKIHSSSIAHGDLKMSTLFHTIFSDATDHRSKIPCELNVDLNLDELFTSPPSLLPASNVS
eukprot:scaffold17571_cov154-Skeletonema_dohrnii-CCMP3373.AAC.3